MTPTLKRFAVPLLCALAAACVSARGELDKMLDEQIGKPADDPNGFRAQHRQDRVYVSRPRGGKIEEEYRIGFRNNCRVFLTIDDRERKIANWRYEGPDEDCIGSSNIGGSRKK